MLNEHLRVPEPEIGLIVGRIEAAIKRKEEYRDRKYRSENSRYRG